MFVFLSISLNEKMERWKEYIIKAQGGKLQNKIAGSAHTYALRQGMEANESAAYKPLFRPLLVRVLAA